MDADSADDDGGEHETGNGEANSNSHLLLRLGVLPPGAS